MKRFRLKRLPESPAAPAAPSTEQHDWPVVEEQRPPIFYEVLGEHALRRMDAPQKNAVGSDDQPYPDADGHLGSDASQEPED